MGLERPGSMLMLLLLLFSPTTVSKGANCDYTIYGKPTSSDCSTLFQKFTSPQDLRARLFDEEQLRADDNFDWPGVENVFSQPIVQLPKYYSMNTCNFAIMPYTNPRTLSVNPLGISNWLSIKTAGEELMATCLKEPAGGEIFIKDQTSINPVLVLFMWQSGANYFEEKLNFYENNPKFVPQLSLSVTGVNESSASLTNLSASETVTIAAPATETPPISIEETAPQGSVDVS